MAATIDGANAMDSILYSFDEICDEFRNGINVIQTLQSNYNAEVKKREVLEFTVHNLQSENERLTKLYMESVSKLADKIELHTSCQSLKEELKRVTGDHRQKESEYRNAVDLLKQDYATKIQELESQIRGYQIQKVESDAVINQFHRDLAVQRNHIEFLTKRLEEVSSNVESRYHFEIQGLKDCLLVEQDEKNELSMKIQDLEKEVLISRTKLADHQLDLASNQHVATLKQKVMKLRKENEVLKRKLHDSKEG